MSRLKKFTQAIVSGYLQIGVNVLYTLASIPLALHYLSAKEFALWQVAAAVAGYLMLVDFGMTGAAARILIDHKDKPDDGPYGSVIKISLVVFSIQGLIIAGFGTALSFWMPQLINLSDQFPDPAGALAASRALIVLTAGQCVLQGIFFPARVFWNLGVAHQRYDLYNYAQVGSLIVSFVSLWLGFEQGMGIYSVLFASGTGLLFGFCCGWIAAVKLRYLPRRGHWGKFDTRLFREIFRFGGNSFLMAVGYQLTNATQVLIISNLLGLEAGAVWAVATKPFMLAQQLVGRIFSFACSPLAEMIVRHEHERLRRRFRDLVVFSAAIAIFIAGGIALCNESFLQVWLRDREILSTIHAVWNPWNNFLLAAWFIITSLTSNHVTVVGLTKQIGRMRYVYFCEGVIFLAVAIFLAPDWGIPGIITAAIAANLMCSGIFGVRRTVEYFKISAWEAVFGWLAGPLKFLALFALVLAGCRLLTGSLPPLPGLAVKAAVAGVFGLWLFWRFGLNRDLRGELARFASKIRLRVRA